MAISSNTSKAIGQLKDAGIIPPQCRRFELVAEAGKPVLLRLEVLATEEQVQQIADALERNSSETGRIARTIMFKCAQKAVGVDLP